MPTTKMNFLLLRIPDSQTVENDMYLPRIEVTYNSTGLPKGRRIVPGANSYGVCGESYIYNSNNQIRTESSANLLITELPDN